MHLLTQLPPLHDMIDRLDATIAGQGEDIGPEINVRAVWLYILISSYRAYALEAEMSVMLSSTALDPPPMDGRWILARSPNLPNGIATRPWIIATRSDEGFIDEMGECLFEPEAWAPLPDPQPIPTNWAPPAGTIVIERGRILEAGWQGWIVHIVRPDGSNDDREPWLFNDDEEGKADAKADFYVRRYGLTLDKRRGEVERPNGNVIDFETAKRGLQ